MSDSAGAAAVFGALVGAALGALVGGGVLLFDEGEPPEPAIAEIQPGFFEVESFPASAIPWGDTEPGWFLVQWGDTEIGRRDPATPRSLSILSPEGEWYALAEFDDIGLINPQVWYQNTLLGWFEVDNDNPHKLETEVSTFDFRKSKIVDTHEKVSMTAGFPPLAEGLLVETWLEVEDFVIAYSHYFDGEVSTELCRAPNGRSGISPSGTRMVCLEEAAGAANHTEVVLVEFDGNNSTREVIDSIRLQPVNYLVFGWLSDSEFVFQRFDEGTYDYFLYNVEDGTLVDYVPPVRSEIASGDWVGIRRGVYIHRTSGGFEFTAIDGSPLATVLCTNTAPQASLAAASGSTVLVECAKAYNAEGSIVLTTVDLVTGETHVVADVWAEADRDIERIYPHHERKLD